MLIPKAFQKLLTAVGIRGREGRQGVQTKKRKKPEASRGLRHRQSVVYILAAHAHGGGATLTAVLPQLTLASTRSCLFRDVCCLQVFLDFISYSGGPLPEDLLEVIKVPVVIAWGDQDPWEPIEQGRAFADFDSVEVKREQAQQATVVCV